MTWNLFIDDERNIEDVTWAPWQVREKYRNEEWVICRNYVQVMTEIMIRDFPSFISFDHDLGDGEPTGYDIVKELVEIDMTSVNEEARIPDGFNFYVHSQNPIGKANIEGLLNNYLKHRS